MGMFDLFGKSSRSVDTKKDEMPAFRQSVREEEKGPVSVFSPTSYADVEKIINAIKQGKTAIVHLTALKTDTAIRILDMLSGAIYALDGGVYEMQKNIFMFSPNGVEVNG